MQSNHSGSGSQELSPPVWRSAASSGSRESPRQPALEALLQALPDGTCVLDRSGRIRAANRRCHQILGLPESALLPGTEFSEILVRQAERGDFGPEAVLDGAADLRAGLAENPCCQWTGQLSDGRAFRITCRDLDGQFRLLLCEDCPEQAEARDEAQKLREMLESEMADREQLEQRWLASAEHLRLFVDHTPAAVSMLDREMKYLTASRRRLRDYGLEEEEIVGRCLYDIVPDIPHRWKEVHRRVLETGIGESSEEDCYMRADGTVEWSRWKVFPWLTSDGEVGGLILFDEIITERKNLEVQLLQAQKMEAVGQMTGGLAHDFNNLLHVVGGNLGLLHEQLTDNATAQSLVDDALSALRRGSELTQRLLAFSRDRELSPQVFNVGLAVTDLARLIRRTLTDNIQFEVSVQGGPWFCCLQRIQLESAVLNLAINSRDAMPEGGHLRIEVGPENSPNGDGGQVLIRVSDNGCGMPPDVLKRAVEPFFTTKEAGCGSGLGLSMVRDLITKEGGRFDIQSTPERGTTICMVFPRWTGEQEVATTATKSPSEAHQETVLLTDDDTIVRRVASSMLSEIGYTVLEASSLAETVDLLRGERRVDLLLTDLGLREKLDGFDLAHEAILLRPDLKVIFMSGDPLPVDPTFRALSSLPILVKPFDRDQLAQALSTALDGPEDRPYALNTGLHPATVEADRGLESLGSSIEPGVGTAHHRPSRHAPPKAVNSPPAAAGDRQKAG